VTLNHDGKSNTKTLSLEKGWRKTEFLWRASRWSLRPEPGFWAPALTEKEITALGNAIDPGVTPIRVQFINNNKPIGKAVRDAGIKEGDVIIALDGKPFTFNPQTFQMHIRLDHKAGDTLHFKVLRNGKTKDIDLTLVE